MILCFHYSNGTCRWPIVYGINFYCIGKQDGEAWNNYVKEVDDWLNSKDGNKGVALFKEIEWKIMAELESIIAHRRNTQRRRRLLAKSFIKDYTTALESLSGYNSTTISKSSRRRQLSETDKNTLTSGNVPQLAMDLAHEMEIYHGNDDPTDRVYVYLAADNERVKEAFAEYLLGHQNISIMRVRTADGIVHAKNTGK